MSSNEITPIRITVREGVYLSKLLQTDKPALVQHLSTPEIHQNTLTIPYPYQATDADSWLSQRIEHAGRIGVEVTFAIRNQDDALIGVLGADGLERGTHRAELGYWIAKPYWGQGIMSDAVRAYVKYAFSELQLTRLVAHVFELNIGSARVLENNGFKLEGRLREHYLKNGKLLDARVYGLLKREKWD